MLFKIFLSNTIICYHKEKNDYVFATKGYSFSFLFFIFSFPSIVAFHRKDYKMMIFLILLATFTMILLLISKFLTLISLIIYYGFLFYLSFVYNSWYLRRILKLNYKFIDASSVNDEFVSLKLSESEIQASLDDSYLIPENYKSLLVKKFLTRFVFSLLLFIIYILLFFVLIILKNKFII